MTDKLQELINELKSCKTFEDFQKLLSKMEKINENVHDILVWFQMKHRIYEPYDFIQKTVFGEPVETVDYLISDGRGHGCCKVKNLHHVIKIVEN